VAVIDRAEAATGAEVTRMWADLRDISPQLALAVLVAEDIEFYQHRGFSWAEIRSALADARAGRGMRGASTITQQLAKNLWLSPERSALRKLAEAVLAADLERFAGKRRILELYLNVVQFGPGAFGAEAAAMRYFGKPSLFLTEDESAMLAAGLTQPSRWNPASTLPDYRARVELIRRRMTNAEFLWRHLLQL
jgi:monofunctional biosynthetic peptidoglycan transglycosylase